MELQKWLDGPGSSWNDATLADALSVSRAAVYQWRTGANLPSVPMLARLQELSGGMVTAAAMVRAVERARDGAR